MQKNLNKAVIKQASNQETSIQVLRIYLKYIYLIASLFIRRCLPVRLTMMNRNVRFREADLGRVSMKLR